ncbi:GAF domain-containing protein [candidate division FCPU426 bacterium]|nr:GAF domain-containing protein [candidate division FCPU426 bacterium]
MKKKKVKKQPVLRTAPPLSADVFVQGVLEARGRKQAARQAVLECKRLLGADQTWIMMVPADDSRPWILNLPDAPHLPAALPPGLVRYALDRDCALAYHARTPKPFACFNGKQNRWTKAPNQKELEERRQRDLAWWGKNYREASLFILPLDIPRKSPPQQGAAAKILIARNKNWKQADWKNLATFIPFVRMALAMTDQKKHLERRLRQSTAVSEIAQNINSSLDMNILMRLILLEITKAMQCQGGDIWLKPEKSAELVFHSALGVDADLRGMLASGERARQVLQTGGCSWIDNIQQDAQLSASALAAAGMVSLAIVPLKTKNKAIGVMHLFAKQRRVFTAEERILMQTLANQAATAINNARLFEETKRRAQELLALYEIAQVISEMSNVNYALEQIVHRVSEVLNVEKCWIMFHDKERRELAAHPAAVGMDEAEIQNLRLSIAGPGISAHVFRSARPVFINRTAEQQEMIRAEIKGMFTLRNIMAVPLRGQEQTLGVFLVANKREADKFAGNDVRLFRTLASEATVIIQNANLYDKLKRSYHSVVRVISGMVDAREPYTQGHSERVSLYATMIARQLQLPQEEIERIQMAGLLHDIGKIGIAENILLKPAKLSAEEYETMKRHSEIGVQILKDVEFPWEIKDLILHHHEHYDGRGYPGGIQGEAIPLGARIIAVCDALDVITSARTYHQAKTPWDAFRIISKEAGSQFDPGVVAAFEKIWPRLSEEIEKGG